MSTPRFPGPGHHTAWGGTLDYRLGKLERLGVVCGDWLDLGCADGYYSVGLAARGALRVVGAEISADLVGRANKVRHPDSVSFVVVDDMRLPFADNSFDGVLMNEVLEHVNDERATLSEVHRVLRPGGVLALFSPNRWFPFEGHGAQWSDTRSLLGTPVPLMPWLPRGLTNRVARARNYWPHELARLVTQADMEVVNREWTLAQFAQYPWLPTRLAAWYHRNLSHIEHSPIARFFAVSTFITARPSNGYSTAAAPARLGGGSAEPRSHQGSWSNWTWESHVHDRIWHARGTQLSTPRTGVRTGAEAAVSRPSVQSDLGGKWREGRFQPGR